MANARLSVLGLLCLASASSAIFQVRDIDGNWRSFEKRASKPGDPLRLALSNNADQSYSIPVRMGTPFQEIQMAISLSQNHILVASSDNSGDAGFYNSALSSTFARGNTSTVVYGTGGATTTANFAGESCQILDFNYNASIAITPASANTNYDLYPKSCHGVLGYGVDPAPGTPADSTLLGAYLPKNIPSAVCGIELNWPDDPNQGIFTMGATDSSAYTGDFTTMTVPPATSIQRPSWSIPIDGLFASVETGTESIAGSLASIDPYYPSIQLPANAVALLYSKIPNAVVSTSNANRYTVPCNAKFELTLMFSGRNFTMLPRDSISNENGTCYGVVEATSGNSYKIGSPFMRNVYTTFGATFNSTGAVFNVAFATKVIRPDSHASSAGATSKPNAVISLLFACTFMLIA